jgi:hypothetical protein
VPSAAVFTTSHHCTVFVGPQSCVFWLVIHTQFPDGSQQNQPPEPEPAGAVPGLHENEQAATTTKVRASAMGTRRARRERMARYSPSASACNPSCRTVTPGSASDGAEMLVTSTPCALAIARES